MKLSNVELNILVAERVMGLTVLGIAPCIYIDGCADVAVTWSSESSYVFHDPVYLPSEHATPCERCAEPEGDVYGKFRGYSDGCLKIVPRYAEDVSVAMEICDKADGAWSLERYRETDHKLYFKCSVRFGDSIGTQWGCASPAEAICKAALRAKAGQRLKETDA